MIHVIFIAFALSTIICIGNLWLKHHLSWRRLNAIGAEFGLSPRYMESVEAFKARCKHLQSGRTYGVEDVKAIEGVRSVKPGKPGEVVITAAWWASLPKIQVEAGNVVPLYCMFRVRRETVKEWWAK